VLKEITGDTAVELREQPVLKEIQGIREPTGATGAKRRYR